MIQGQFSWKWLLWPELPYSASLSENSRALIRERQLARRYADEQEVPLYHGVRFPVDN